MTKEQVVANLLSIAEQVDSILMLAVLLSLIVVVAKLAGFKHQAGRGRSRSSGSALTLTFEWLQTHINLDYAWLVMLALTTVHVFVGFLLLRSIASIVDCNDVELANAAWVALTTEANKLRAFYALEARSPFFIFGVPVSFAQTSDLLRDPIVLLHLFMAVVFFAAIVRIRRATNALRIITLFMGAVLVAANWTVGSQWVLAASDLYFVSRNEPIRMRDTHKWVLRSSGKSCPIAIDPEEK